MEAKNGLITGSLRVIGDIYGSLKGNADTATKATEADKTTKDGASNVIDSTYIKSLKLSGRKVTPVLGNGNDGTAITIPSTATAFDSNAAVTLTGDITGSANGTHGWSIATTIGDGKVTNAKLANSTVSIAGQSLSLGGSISADSLRNNLGLSNAMHFIGIDISETFNPNSKTIKISSTQTKDAAEGDVCIHNTLEYVWANNKWNLLGQDGSYALDNNAVHKTSAEDVGGVKTFTDGITVSKAAGFIYSGIETGSSNKDRNVWFADSSNKGTPVVNNKFKYNPSTDTLTVGKVVATMPDYIKGLSASGRSITYTKGDGSTSSVSLTMPEAYLTWGGQNFTGSYGPIDAAMISDLGANRLAMFTDTSSCVDIEYSQDGGQTWADYGANNGQKANLFNGLGTTNFYIGKSDITKIDKTKYQLRVTINDTKAAKIYTNLNKFVIYCSTGGSKDCYCTIQGRTQQDKESNINTWKTFANEIPISGQSGYNVINTNGIITYAYTDNKSSQYGQLRFIFGAKTHPSTVNYGGLAIMKIYGFGGVGWTTPSNLARFNHLYTYDANQTAIFPADIKATGVFRDNSGVDINTKYYASSSFDSSTKKLTLSRGNGSTANSVHTLSFVSTSGDTMTGALNLKTTGAAPLRIYKDDGLNITHNIISDAYNITVLAQNKNPSASLWLSNYKSANNTTTGTITASVDDSGKTTITADNFKGLASKATGDGNGNTIISSYASTLSVSDNTLSLKAKNGQELATAKVWTQDAVPSKPYIMSKTFENVSIKANNALEGYLFFGTIRPSNYQTMWHIKYQLQTSIANQTNGDGLFIVDITGSGNTYRTYAMYNAHTSTSYRSIYYHALKPVSSAGYSAGYGHAFGEVLQNSWNPVNNPRTMKFTVLEQDNCVISFFDNPVTASSIPGTQIISGSSIQLTSYYNVSTVTFDGANNGLQETGDGNDTTTLQQAYTIFTAGSSGIQQYSLMMEEGHTGTYSSFTKNDGTGTSKTKSTIGFNLGKIYYNARSSNTNKGSKLSTSCVRLYTARVDMRYSLNCGTTLVANKPLYIKGSISNDGLFYLADPWWTQTQPTTEDGCVYILIGYPYDTYRCDFAGWQGAYWYKNGLFREYSQQLAYEVDITNKDTVDENTYKAMKDAYLSGREVRICFDHSNESCSLSCFKYDDDNDVFMFNNEESIIRISGYNGEIERTVRYQKVIWNDNSVTNAISRASATFYDSGKIEFSLLVDYSQASTFLNSNKAAGHTLTAPQWFSDLYSDIGSWMIPACLMCHRNEPFEIHNVFLVYDGDLYLNLDDYGSLSTDWQALKGEIITVNVTVDMHTLNTNYYA